MKIVDVKSLIVEIPLIPLAEGGIAPYRGHNLPVGKGLVKASSLIYKVATDEGIIGWGESNQIINKTTHLAIFENLIKPVILGKDPYDVLKICSQLLRSIETPVASNGIISGVEIACWDIIGKACNQPVYNLIGGRIRENIEIAYCLGIYSEEETVEKIKQIKAQKYRVIKTKGGENVELDIQRAHFFREQLGNEIKLRIDMNRAYDVSEAIRYLNGVDGLNLEYIEQPIPTSQFSALQSLRARAKTPIAINEDCYIRHNLFECIKRNAIDIAVVDLDQIGGITRMTKIANLCSEAGLPLAHHCGFDMGIKLAAILHVNAALEAFTHAMDSTYMAHQDDILTEKIVVKDGNYLVPELPGLGITVDEEKVEKYTVD
jgi:L-alanine-DL-glutamate epimerase-like enolase superfamily enzyme